MTCYFFSLLKTLLTRRRVTPIVVNVLPRPHCRFWVSPESVGNLVVNPSLIQAHSVSAEKVAASVAEIETYIHNNCQSIPNFGEHRRQGKPISTVLSESTINQVVSRRFV